MKIEISYQQFTKSTHFACIDALVTNPPLTPRQVFEKTVKAIDQAFGGLEPEVKFKTKHLFLPTDWERMSDGITRKVGMCLSYMTINELIPLQFANRPGCTNKSYMLKPGIVPDEYSFVVC